MILDENGQEVKIWKLEPIELFILLVMLIIFSLLGLGTILYDPDTQQIISLEKLDYWKIAYLAIALPIVSFSIIGILKSIRIVEFLYDEPTYFPSDYENRSVVLNRCILCKRHPFSKKYHVEKIHQIKTVKFEDYFENCKCNICNPESHQY